MAFRGKLRHQCRVVRRVTVELGEAVVDEGAEFWVPALVESPRDDEPESDESPRDAPTATLQYAVGLGALDANVSLHAGARIERWREAGIYELLSDPKKLFAGTRQEGWEVQVQRTSVLYPSAVTVEEQGGAVVQDSMPCAVWGGSGRRESSGEYVDLEGEAPVEFASDLKSNRQLVLGNLRLRIVDAVTDLTGPRIKLQLRAPR